MALSRHSPRRLYWLFSLVLVLIASPVSGQVVELDLRNTTFHEASSVGSQMTVLNPSAALTVSPWDFLSINAGYEADIVSGATEPVKAGPLSPPDIISQASIDDVRSVFTGGFTITREQTRLSAAYSYGTESDYRSQAITVSAGTDFLKRNTQIDLAYARGFDEVCNAAYAPSLDPSVRPTLDSSDGCFTDAANRQREDVNLDNFQAAWTQAWTPVLTTQVVGTFQLQNGFLGNPYRGVVIGPTGQIAQENHPGNRARTAFAVRAKYYVRDLKTAFGIGVRGYRDTWDILSQTYHAEVERFMLPWLRLLVRGRYYSQSEALFWSDDYTGGEPLFGPRGQYWSGDREVSPLKSYSLGGRVVAAWQGAAGDRIGGVLLSAKLGTSLDVVKTNLEDFTLAGQEPDDTLAIIWGVNIAGGF